MSFQLLSFFTYILILGQISFTYGFPPFISSYNKISNLFTRYLSPNEGNMVEEITGDLFSKKNIPIVKSDFLDISIARPFGMPCEGVAAATDEINSIISDGFEEYSRHFRVEYLVKYLENIYVPIHTPAFFNLAHSGKWKLVYSSWLTPFAESQLNTSVTQSIKPADESDSEKGEILNNITWSFLESSGKFSFGSFLIKCEYKMTITGALAVKVVENVLLPEIIPDDVEDLIVKIQRSIPFEIFDPDGSIMGTSFINPNFRVARMLNSNVPNVINIYRRIA